MRRCFICYNKLEQTNNNYIKIVNSFDNRETYLCGECNTKFESFYLFKSNAENNVYKYVNKSDTTKTTLYGIEFEFEHKDNYPIYRFYKGDNEFYRSIDWARGSLIINLMINLGYYRTINTINSIVDDGSLSDNSSELITYPRSFNWLRYNNTLRDMLKIMLQYGYTDNTEAGLHISFNINSVGRSVVYKIMSFLIDNKVKVANISMRRNFYYAEFDEDAMMSIPSDKKYLVLSARSDRRAELRLFKGTLRYDRVMRAIEFIDALVNMYCSGYSNTTNFDTFIDYLNMHNKRYDTLLNFLVERNIIESISV